MIGEHEDLGGDLLRRGPVLRSLLLTFVSAFLGLAVVDIVVGQLDRDRDLRRNAELQPDSNLGWTNRPGIWNEKITISSLGLRSPEIPPDAHCRHETATDDETRPDGRRIIV